MIAYNVCSLQNFILISTDKELHINEIQIVHPDAIPNPAIFTEDFLRQAGTLKFNSFKNKVYFMSSFDVDDSYDKADFSKQHLSFRSMVYQVINFLWFVKDSSASTLEAYSVIPDKPDFFLASFFGAGNSKAGGSYDDTTFDLADFKIALKAYSIMGEVGSQDYQRKDTSFPIGTMKVLDSGYHFGMHDKTNIIERCMTFLSTARTNSYLPIKITNYVAALECIFTTDIGEVNHKVAERASRYVAHPDSRLAMFKFVKRIYGIRSDFFHGKAQKPKHGSTETLADIATEIDVLLRHVLTRVFHDRRVFLENKENLTAFFDELIFQDSLPKTEKPLEEHQDNKPADDGKLLDYPPKE